MRRKNLIAINKAAVAACSDAYANLPPPLPDIRVVTGWLRQINGNPLECECNVWLYCARFVGWKTGTLPGDLPHAEHAELIPGDGKPFDATAAARRLLSEARLAGFK